MVCYVMSAKTANVLVNLFQPNDFWHKSQWTISHYRELQIFTQLGKGKKIVEFSNMGKGWWWGEGFSEA